MIIHTAKVSSFTESIAPDKAFFFQSKSTGPSCSKLTMSLVNVSLKLWSLHMAYMLIFLLKKCSKSYSLFFSKNICEFDIVLTRAVNILTTNEPVKLTRLWTTGPWYLLISPQIIEPVHDKPTKWHVHPAKTQISLGICQVWSESLLCPQWVTKDQNILQVVSEDSDQPGHLPSLIRVFAVPSIGN